VTHSKDELFLHIQKAVRDVLNNPQIEINKDSLLADDLGLESIDFLDMSCELENSLGIEVDFKNIYTKINNSQKLNTSPKEITVQNLIDFLSTQNT
jgi:acyl carrier protein